MICRVLFFLPCYSRILLAFSLENNIDPALDQSKNFEHILRLMIKWLIVLQFFWAISSRWNVFSFISFVIIPANRKIWKEAKHHDSKAFLALYYTKNCTLNGKINTLPKRINSMEFLKEKKRMNKKHTHANTSIHKVCCFRQLHAAFQIFWGI